ncbi:hypothetical protein CU048_06475 [Beijerinckiaceae bacterium]|nr:hypothetical protein CU048_06475 [Beijerinckiaceae bacterium]
MKFDALDGRPRVAQLPAMLSAKQGADKIELLHYPRILLLAKILSKPLSWLSNSWAKDSEGFVSQLQKERFIVRRSLPIF